MRLHHALLPLFFASALPACSDAPIALGETVSEFSKSCLIVFQDRSGNHWFSDGQGVCRYDGRTITRFTTKDGLCNEHIRGIQQHKSGDILITTSGGVSKFDGRRFVTLEVTTHDDPAEGWRLDPNDVWLPLQSGQKGPFLYDGKSLHHLKFPKHAFEDEFFAHSPNLPWSPYEIYCVYRDSRGHMWFGTANFGICRYDGNSLDWMFEKHLTELEGERMFGIRSIFEAQDGAFWFCNTQFRFRISPSTSTTLGYDLIRYEREPGLDLSGTAASDDYLYFMSITEDEAGDLWMATYGEGVWRYDGKTVTHFPVKDGDQDITLFSIYKDHHGKLWLGTHEAGPYLFNGKTFEQFRP
jgi:hypothetical protein